jgi:RecA-family ATPase
MTLICAADLARKPVPPRQWLVEGLIPAKQVTLLSGDGATGKSLLALQLAVAVATGTDWIGTFPEEGNVLILAAEDDCDEIHRRLAAIVKGRSFGLDDLGRLWIENLAGQDAILASPNSEGTLDATALFEKIQTTAREHRPKCLIIDTLADVFGGNEINRAQARQFIGMLRGLAIECDAAVIVLAHPSLFGMANGSGTSGSTAWSNSVRSRLYLTTVEPKEGEEKDETLRRLILKKSNYAQAGAEILLRFEQGKFVPANLCAQPNQFGFKAESEFLALLEQFASEGRKVSCIQGPNYAPRLFAKHPDAKCSQRDFQIAMDSLLSSGRIENREEGTPGRRVRRLVIRPKSEG